MSGHCADGVCCDAECNDKVCQRCDGASVGGAGHCGIAKAGTNLDGECSPPTSVCSGKCKALKTTASCSGTSYSCASRQETVLVPSGQVCSANANVPVSKDDYCSSGNDCADGKCQASRWWTSCDGAGNCRASGDKTDALVEIVTASADASLTSSCSNGSLLCNASPHCGADSLYGGYYCDGAGQCNLNGAAASCGKYTCDFSLAACKTSCTTNADCAQGQACSTPSCHLDWEWANWPVPKKTPSDFVVDKSAGTVVDKITRLVWRYLPYTTTAFVQLTWSEASSYCAGLGEGWRLPTRIELLSIDSAGYDIFPGEGEFWASTPSASAAGYAWEVDRNTGYRVAMSRDKTLKYWARCVKAPPEGEMGARYDVSTHVVVDKRTGLTWQRGLSEYRLGSSDAQPYCQKLALPGFPSNWRTPTKEELETLVDVRVAWPGPTIDVIAFPATPAEAFHNCVYFDGGQSSTQCPEIDEADGSSISRWVRCVRDTGG